MAELTIIAFVFGAWRSPVSALAWGVRGRRFESSRPDYKTPNLKYFMVRSFYFEVLNLKPLILKTILVTHAIYIQNLQITYKMRFLDSGLKTCIIIEV